MRIPISRLAISVLAVLLVSVLASTNAGAVLEDDEDVNDTCCSDPDLIKISRMGIATTGLSDTGRFVLTGDPAGPCDEELGSGAGDIDYVGIGGLQKGDVITVATTPLKKLPNECPGNVLGPCTGALEVPDTIIQLFDSNNQPVFTTHYDEEICSLDDAADGLCIEGEPWPDPGTSEVYSDDSPNNFLGRHKTGSFFRYLIQDNGNYYVAVTGFDDSEFTGCHPDADEELDPYFGPDSTTGPYALTITISPKVGGGGGGGGCGLGAELAVLMPLLLQARKIRRRRS
jgi:hypothetical protein